MRTPKNIETVVEGACNNPSTSISRRSYELNILTTALCPILRNDFGLMSCEVQLLEES